MTWLQQLFGFFKAFQLWIVIAPWEAGLRVRLGNKATTLPPGIHFRLPFLDRIFVQTTRLRSVADTCQTLTTSDGRVLTISIAASYSIADIAKLYASVSAPENTLLLTIQGIIAAFICTHTLAEVTPTAIEAAVAAESPGAAWGLGDVSARVNSFAVVRAVRLIGDGYRVFNQGKDAIDTDGAVG